MALAATLIGVSELATYGISTLDGCWIVVFGFVAANSATELDFRLWLSGREFCDRKMSCES